MKETYKKMTKEELEKEKCELLGIIQGKDKVIQELEKENAELKEKISVLLSCKNCPENKGGWICAKEYEDKCLAQKIEFIKELEKENAELKEQLGDKVMQKQKDKADLVWKLKTANEQKASQLYKAKEIIKDYLTIAKGSHTTLCGVSEENRTIYVLKLNEEAEQFLKENT